MAQTILRGTVHRSKDRIRGHTLTEATAKDPGAQYEIVSVNV